MAGACVFDIIISKLCHQYEPSLIVLLKINKDLEIVFYNTILIFDLAIIFLIKGGEKPMLDAEEVTKQWSKFRGKYGVSIGENWVQKAVMIHYHVYYYLYKLGCIDNDLDWFVIDHFCEPINKDQNRVVTFFLPIDWDW